MTSPINIALPPKQTEKWFKQPQIGDFSPKKNIALAPTLPRVAEKRAGRGPWALKWGPPPLPPPFFFLSRD